MSAAPRNADFGEIIILIRRMRKEGRKKGRREERERIKEGRLQLHEAQCECSPAERKLKKKKREG